MLHIMNTQVNTLVNWVRYISIYLRNKMILLLLPSIRPRVSKTLSEIVLGYFGKLCSIISVILSNRIHFEENSNGFINRKYELYAYRFYVRL